MTNPLLQDHTLPPFDNIKPADVVPAISELIEKAESHLSALLTEQQSATQKTALSSEQQWLELIAPIEESDDRIDNAWAPVSHLNAVANNDELRQAYEQAQQKLTAYHTAFGQNEALYRAYQQIADSADFKQLDQQKKKSITDSLRNFRLSGVNLEGENKKRFAELQAELSQLGTTFANNVLDAGNGWVKRLTDEKELAGLPAFLVTGAQQAAQKRKLEGYVLTLDIPVYMTVMTQSENRELRREMYEAYNTRASRFGPTANQWDNTDNINQIVTRRQELANLLGFDNYAQVSIASKMAESPEQVIGFLQDLADKTRPFAEQELQELQAFAKEQYQTESLDAWDIPYFSEKLKIAKYDISQEQLRPYFPLPVVLDGLFRVAKTLYSIDVTLSEAQTWNEHAQYYEIRSQGKQIAGFYLDLHARAEKRGGAWMAGCRTRRQKQGQLQLPVSFLVCNFNPANDGQACLLTHNEVTTLFHEFGHGLHHMLTQMDVAAVSGISGVAWDAVELPSQFMENFCWQREVLAFLSQHHQSKEALPATLLDNMLAAKNFQSALQMLRQLEFAIFDLRLHMEYGGDQFQGVQALLDEVRQKTALIIPPKFNQFQNGFSHIFAGGYAAGYYSYKWAEVLSADAFSAFEEEGLFNPETGQRFLNEILAKGGSDEAMNLFINFRGRKPDAEALMRHSGLN
ncbi:MAG: oligopeptidase A [Alteromonadaceae bacterium]|nr:MAG: oligopeptidase A [Alteromonadaceae bacterium]